MSTLIPLLDRLESRIEKTSDCWIWKGKVDKTGYGSFGLRDNGVSRTRSAHKIVYEVLVGEIPQGFQLDHSCHDPEICFGFCPHRLCVNPSHLEIVTPKQNVLRSNGLAAKNAAKTHCLNGHELSGENLYVPPNRPDRRYCRECPRQRLKNKV